MANSNVLKVSRLSAVPVALHMPALHAPNNSGFSKTLQILSNASSVSSWLPKDIANAQ